MGDDIQRQALARDLARRLQLASLDELRVVDRTLTALEFLRAGDPTGGDELASDYVGTMLANLEAEDRLRAQLHEQARAEMLGDTGEGA
jgi:hypothetical protein